ncbi:hypothetical protein C8Q74DRAFT_1372614 [Fomes fomentarius]|nr:hypothetical protein C8Q74DRAFT_1372614 [Fomes fomentarius]
MSIPDEPVTVQPQPESRPPVTITYRSYTSALVEVHLYIHRRQGITPAPSHRKAIHPLESDKDLDLVHVSNAAPILIVNIPSTNQLMDTYEVRPSPRLVPVVVYFLF